MDTNFSTSLALVGRSFQRVSRRHNVTRHRTRSSSERTAALVARKYFGKMLHGPRPTKTTGKRVLRDHEIATTAPEAAARGRAHFRHPWAPAATADPWATAAAVLYRWWRCAPPATDPPPKPRYFTGVYSTTSFHACSELYRRAVSVNHSIIHARRKTITRKYVLTVLLYLYYRYYVQKYFRKTQVAQRPGDDEARATYTGTPSPSSYQYTNSATH